MIDLLSGRPAQLLAETLLHFLWQGAAVALFLLLIDPLLRTVQNKHAASLGALLLMLALPVATCYTLAQRELAPANAELSFDTPSSVSDEPGQIPQAALSHWQPLFVCLWLTGVSLLAARLLVGFIATLWLRGDRRPLPAELALKVGWIGRRLGVATRCRVFLSARITEAIAVGCFKPLVLIPLAWASELPPSALEAVIAHELAHIRRWDLWVTLLQRLAETLLFYHPAVWWLSRRLSQQRELCCDALAVSATRSPADYVLALETIARRTSAPPLTLATAFLGGGKMNLLDRVRHVLAGSPREASAWWSAGLAALAAPLLAALAVGSWSLVPATALADDDEAPAEVLEEAEEGLLELGLQFLMAHQSDEEALSESEEGEEAEAGAYMGLVIQLLKAGDENEDKDDEEGDDEALLRRAKRAALAERQGREAEEAVEREVKRLKAAKEEAVVKRIAKKKLSDDFDLAEFRPETEREARLLAVIKKLQSQVKGRSSGAVEKSEKEFSAAKDPAMIYKHPEAIYEYKVLGKRLEEGDEAHERAQSEKETAMAQERAAQRKRAIAEKQALLAKERAAKEQASKEEQHRRERESADEEDAYQRALKDAIVRQQKEAAMAAEKEVYRKLKDAEKAQRTDHEVEKLRRALQDRDAEVQKLHEALRRFKRDAPGKRDPGPDEEDRKDKEEQSSKDPRAIDNYIIQRLHGVELHRQDEEAAVKSNDVWRIEEAERLNRAMHEEAAAKRNDVWLDVFGILSPESD